MSKCQMHLKRSRHTLLRDDRIAVKSWACQRQVVLRAIVGKGPSGRVYLPSHHLLAASN